jgi:ribonuclease E
VQAGVAHEERPEEQIAAPAPAAAHVTEAAPAAAITPAPRVSLPATEEVPSAPQAFAAPQPAEAALPPALKLEWPSDLKQIETNPEKARAAAEAAAQEPPRLYAKRVRPALVPMSNEPLVQVETRHGDGAAAQL